MVAFSFFASRKLRKTAIGYVEWCPLPSPPFAVTSASKMSLSDESTEQKAPVNIISEDIMLREANTPASSGSKHSSKQNASCLLCRVIWPRVLPHRHLKIEPYL